MNYKRFADIFLHLIWPSNCPVCGKPAEIICPECLKSLFAEKVITKNLDSLEINSASFYHSAIKELISLFKYSGVRSLCRPIGKIMAEFFTKPENVDYIVPVPLHLQSDRNYNQALEISKGLSEIWNIKISDCSKWSKIVPRRAGLDAKERMKLNYDSFRITENIKNLRIVIVDDVCTTGTTLLRFSEACRRSGADVVKAFTLATVAEN